jgi:hypothetical protein
MTFALVVADSCLCTPDEFRKFAVKVSSTVPAVTLLSIRALLKVTIKVLPSLVTLLVTGENVVVSGVC